MQQRATVLVGVALFATLAAIWSPSGGQPVEADTSIKITDPIPASPASGGEVFFDELFSVSYAGGMVRLSASPDGTGDVVVDDEIIVTVVRPDWTVATFNFDYSHGCQGYILPSPPQDITWLFRPGTNTMRVQFRDICGASKGSSAFWLAIGNPPPQPCSNCLDPTNLQAGDILVERGGPAYLRDFLSLGGTYYTHSAIYLGGGKIAEAAGNTLPSADQVRVRDLIGSEWWTGGSLLDWAVIRAKASGGLKGLAMSYASQKANQTSPDILFQWPPSNKWREDQFYCAQLVWRSYQRQGLDLEANRGIVSSFPWLREIVTPDDLYYSSTAGKSTVVQQRSVSIMRGIKRGIFRLFSPGDMLLIDPLGRRLGVDPATGEVLSEIPDALYSGPDAEVETITVLGVEGEWRLEVTGTGYGEYTLGAEVVDSENPVDQVITAQTYPGKLDAFAIVDPAESGGSILVDKIPPVTQVSLDPSVPDGLRDWYVSDVTVTLTATDNMPGDILTKYRVNGGAWEDYAGPFVVDTEGWNQVDFYSTDVAGNVEDTKNVRFKLDETPPDISITESILDGLHWDQIHLERGILTNTDTLGLSGNGTDNLCLWEVRAVDVDSGQTLASQQPDGANTPDWPPPYPPSLLGYGLNVPLHTGINNIDVVAEDCAGWEKAIFTQVVYVVPGPYDPRSKGFWYNAVKTGKYSETDFQTLLDYVNVVSDTWGPAARNIYGQVTMSNYRGILNTNATDMEKMQKAQLLGAWLNLVSGRAAVLTPADLTPVMGWAQVVDNTGGSPLTFALNVPMEVEEVDQTRAATRPVYEIAKNLLDAFNNRRIIP